MRALIYRNLSKRSAFQARLLGLIRLARFILDKSTPALLFEGWFKPWIECDVSPAVEITLRLGHPMN
jgi:hypothetical protein